MQAYIVTKPAGTTDQEFEAYTRLLAEVGIDVSRSLRAIEPAPPWRWLYAWRQKLQAERFTAILRERTDDPFWQVLECELDREEFGPVAPLEVARVADETGYTYFLMPASRERVVTAYPGTRLPTGLTLTVGDQQELLRTRNSDWFDELARFLTGRSDDEIDALGGVRFQVGGNPVAYQRIPTASEAPSGVS